MHYFLFIICAVFFAHILPAITCLFFGWVFTRFERTRDLGVYFYASSMVAPKLTAKSCHHHCESTPCKNWTCENFHCKNRTCENYHH